MAAIEQAFNSYIPSEKFPVCVLELKIHPALVDVNVHPAKLEVKFSNEQAVFDAVYSAVRTALENKLSRPAFSLKTKDEVKKEARVLNAFIPIKENPTDIQVGKGEQISLKDIEKRKQAVSDMHLYSKHTEELPPHLRFGKKEDTEQKQDPPLPFAFDTTLDNTIPSSKPITDTSHSSTENSDNINEDAFTLPTIAPQNRISTFEPIKSAVSNTALKAMETPAKVNAEPQHTEPKTPIYSVSAIPRPSAIEEIKDIPEYKIIGEAFNSYVMVETEGTLLMIDKHAAHERILFEDMKKNAAKGASSQLLLLPLTVELSNEELDAAESYRAEICAMGFEYSAEKNSHSVNITAIPANISNGEAETLFVTVTGHLAAGTGNIGVTRNMFFEQALYQASCKAAIKAGRIYDAAYIKWICERVITDSAVRVCPHGRPVAFELTKNEIEHRFKRK